MKFKKLILCHFDIRNSLNLMSSLILKSEFYDINFMNLYTILKNYSYNFMKFVYKSNVL